MLHVALGRWAASSLLARWRWVLYPLTMHIRELLWGRRVSSRRDLPGSNELFQRFQSGWSRWSQSMEGREGVSVRNVTNEVWIMPSQLFAFKLLQLEVSEVRLVRAQGWGCVEKQRGDSVRDYFYMDWKGMVVISVRLVCRHLCESSWWRHNKRTKKRKRLRWSV